MTTKDFLYLITLLLIGMFFVLVWIEKNSKEVKAENTTNISIEILVPYEKLVPGVNILRYKNCEYLVSLYSGISITKGECFK